jgi:two-component system cell cycle sensor histidine kinase/response regulator CckA
MRPDRGDTILVVDDDMAIRQLVTALLQQTGYSVIEADSGPKGLACFAEEDGCVDLVLSDITMPHMSGPEMVQEILRIDASVRVMFMTGYFADVELHDRAPNEFLVLQKPFTPETLLRSVRDCLTTIG